MAVRDTLVLDHFYVNADPDEFDDLKKMLEFIPGGSVHSINKTDNDQWEGLYFYERAGSYFEILRDRRSSSFGLALGTCFPVSVDPAKIMEEMPTLEWNVFSRNRESGERWFDALSLNPTPFGKETLLDAWIMKYFPVEFSGASSPKKPRSIDQLSSVILTVGRDKRAEIERLMAWVPELEESTSDGLVFSVPLRDGYRFKVTLNFVDGDERFTWNSIAFKMYDTPAFTDFAMGRFTARANGRDVTITRNAR